MKCPICAVDFEPKRSDAKTCGREACRKALQRNEKVVAANMAALSYSPAKEAAASKWYVDLEEIAEQEYFFTGIPEYDALCGFPKERLSIIYGPEGVGKSTLMYNIIKTLSDNAKVLYIDSEGGINTTRLEELGVQPKNLDIRRDIMLEQAYESILKGAKPYDLIIVDSVSAFTFRAELENEVDAANMGTKAKILTKLTRILPALMARDHCTVIFVNQERDRFDGMGKYMPGGRGQTYASSHTVRLSTLASDKFQKDGRIAGHWVTAEVRKSRFCAPFQKAKFKLFY